jgi:hypothetical protein
MTDPTAPPPDEPDHVHPDVELASAHLDDEVTPEERARIESEPALRSHVEALAAVVDEVREVPAPPPGLLDAHLDAALAELDADADERTGGATVAPLQPRPGRSRWQAVPIGAVAAALIVVALVGAIGLASLGSDDGDDTATSALDADDSDDTFAGSGEALPEASTFDADAAEGGDDGSAGPMADQVERAEFASYDELADELASRPTAASGDDSATEETSTADSPDEATRASGDPCDAVGLLELDPDEVETVLLAVVAGDPVTAVVHTTDDGRRVVVVDDATCQVVLERDL